MTNLDAAFGVDEFVFDPGTLTSDYLTAVLGLDEFVFDPGTVAQDRLRAVMGVDEVVASQLLPVVVQNGYAYAFENSQVGSPVASRNGYAYGFENTQVLPAASRNAYAYGFENTITQTNPTKMYVSDGTAWVRVPWYIWTGTTYQQIV